MKKITTLVAAAVLVCSGAANAQEKSAKKPATKASSEEMQKWQEYMTPGPMHKMMASWEGSWVTDGKFWMDEKTPPNESKGTCVNKMILDGLYQESVHKGDMMGRPFEGHGTLAYDNFRKVFQSTWIDNMGSGIMVLEGTYNASTRTMTLKGNWDDPIKGKVMVRQTVKMIDDKTQQMEMYATSKGKETKWMEMKLTKTP
jgi:hypothetical protein